MATATFGLAVEEQNHAFIVSRYGHRVSLRSFTTRRAANAFKRRTAKACRVDPLTGVHFAAPHVIVAALRSGSASEAK